MSKEELVETLKASLANFKKLIEDENVYIVAMKERADWSEVEQSLLARIEKHVKDFMCQMRMQAISELVSASRSDDEVCGFLACVTEKDISDFEAWIDAGDYSIKERV